MLHNQRASQDHATADVDDEHGHERKKFWALSSSSFAFTCGTRTHLLLLRLLLLRQLAQDEGVRWCPRRHHPGDADPGSARTPGRSPEQAVFCARRPSYFTRPPITAVMQGRSELHCDGLPLVPKHRAQQSFPFSASQRRSLRHQHSSCRQLTSVAGLRKKERKYLRQTLVVVVVVWCWCGQDV